MELIRKGSAREIYRVDRDSLAFRFADKFSVFGCGPHPQEIPEKGRAVCACAVKSFEIARRVGVPTHFIEQMDERTIRVREARVITRPIESWEENYLIPLEWISRFAIAGSLFRDFQRGKEKLTDYGFHSHDLIPEGMSLPWPVHQLTTKFEKVDRPLDEVEAMNLAGLTPKDVTEFWSMIDRLDGALGFAFRQAGFAHFDGKKECAFGLNRQKMIVDVFGTPDEDRPVLLGTLRQGEVVHYGKEFLRQHFVGTGFYAKLQEARAKGEPDPPYPHLPTEVVEAARQCYIVFSWRYNQALV